MPIDNQIEPPQSFMAMYITPGRDRPRASQEVVLARYEQCEDIACALTEHAQTLAFEENFTEPEILARCHQEIDVLKNHGVITVHNLPSNPVVASKSIPVTVRHLFQPLFNVAFQCSRWQLDPLVSSRHE